MSSSSPSFEDIAKAIADDDVEAFGRLIDDFMKDHRIKIHEMLVQTHQTTIPACFDVFAKRCERYLVLLLVLDNHFQTFDRKVWIEARPDIFNAELVYEMAGDGSYCEYEIRWILDKVAPKIRLASFMKSINRRWWKANQECNEDFSQVQEYDYHGGEKVLWSLVDEAKKLFQLMQLPAQYGHLLLAEGPSEEDEEDEDEYLVPLR